MQNLFGYPGAEVELSQKAMTTRTSRSWTGGLQGKTKVSEVDGTFVKQPGLVQG